MTTLTEQERRSARKLFREIADNRHAHERQLEESGATSLRAWRTEMGLTQKHAALLLGVTARGYQKWEEGNRQPPMLATALVYHRIMRAELRAMAWLGVPECHVLRAAWDKRDPENDHIVQVVRNYVEEYRGGQHATLMSNIEALSPAGRQALVDALDAGKI